MAKDSLRMNIACKLTNLRVLVDSSCHQQSNGFPGGGVEVHVPLYCLHGSCGILGVPGKGPSRMKQIQKM